MSDNPDGPNESRSRGRRGIPEDQAATSSTPLTRRQLRELAEASRRAAEFPAPGQQVPAAGPEVVADVPPAAGARVGRRGVLGAEDATAGPSAGDGPERAAESAHGSPLRAGGPVREAGSSVREAGSSVPEAGHAPSRRALRERFAAAPEGRGATDGQPVVVAPTGTGAIRALDDTGRLGRVREVQPADRRAPQAPTGRDASSPASSATASSSPTSSSGAPGRSASGPVSASRTAADAPTTADAPVGRDATTPPSTVLRPGSRETARPAWTPAEGTPPAPTAAGVFEDNRARGLRDNRLRGGGLRDGSSATSMPADGARAPGFREPELAPSQGTASPVPLGTTPRQGGPAAPTRSSALRREESSGTAVLTPDGVSLPGRLPTETAVPMVGPALDRGRPAGSGLSAGAAPTVAPAPTSTPAPSPGTVPLLSAISRDPDRPVVETPAEQVVPETAGSSLRRSHTWWQYLVLVVVAFVLGLLLWELVLRDQGVPADAESAAAEVQTIALASAVPSAGASPHGTSSPRTSSIAPFVDAVPSGHERGES